MNRDEILSCLQTTRIDIQKAIECITEYCKDNNKAEDKIDKLVSLLMQNQMLLQSCFRTALDYLSVKYEINKVLSKENRILLYY